MPEAGEKNLAGVFGDKVGQASQQYLGRVLNEQKRKGGNKVDEKEPANSSLRQRVLQKKKTKKEPTLNEAMANTKDEGMPNMIFIAAIFFAVIKDLVADPLSLLVKATAFGIPLGLLFDWLIIPAIITIPLYIILWLGGSNSIQKQFVKRLIPYALVLVVELIPIVKFIPATILLVIFLKITSSPKIKNLVEKAPVVGEAIEKVL